MPNRPLTRRARRSRDLRARLVAWLGATLLIAGAIVPPAATAAGPRATPDASAPSRADVPRNGPALDARPLSDEESGAVVDTAGPEPSIVYQEAMAHADDVIVFEPGGLAGRGFVPALHDRWPVDGSSPRRLPAARATGRDMARATQGSRWAVLGSGDRAAPSVAAAIDVAATDVAATKATPGAMPPDDSIAAAAPEQGSTSVAPDAAAGLRRQVLGFLPYWELPGSAPTLDYSVLSTIAYFSVGADSAGNLLKRSSDGSLTTGWAGWTSADLTSVINAAHLRHTRVVLTVSVFAWTSSQAASQRALLGSSSARLNLARQVAAAVRDRGADGVNLDFEPLASSYEAEFVALLRTVRAELGRVASGYQLTYDTTGWPGNYPLESSVAAGAADAIFIMGYDYRAESSTYAGSIDPLAGPAYDLTDTVRSYVGRVPPSKVILGLPWYGRAWSTVSSAKNARSQSGAKFGYSVSVNYSNAVALAAQYGRAWDSRESSAWVVYRRQNCTATYGCVTSWRQVYYDDVPAMKLRYDVVNRYGLRGAGIWALGYQGTRTDVWKALADKLLNDRSAPEAGIRMLPTRALDEGFVVTWDAVDQSPIAWYDVQVSVDGGAWQSWRTRTRATSDVWLGKDGHGYAFRVRAQDAKGYLSAWNVTSVWTASPELRAGGFGRVVTDGLAYRAGPALGAQKLGTLSAGTVVAVMNGPVSADGFAWLEVSQPIREWGPVSFVERGVWIAAASSSVTHVVAFRAPNSTTVGAGIRGLGFGTDPATLATGPAASPSRALSPDADGSKDTLRIRWTNTVALDTLRVSIFRPDGSLAGQRAVPQLAAGAASWDWDGTADGSTRLPDGMYILQLTGVAGGTTYRAPSARPVTPAQLAEFGVTIDTVPPTLTGASVSSTVISPNGDGRADTVALRLTGSNGARRWVATVAPLSAGAAGSPIRTITGSGAAMATTWDGRNDAGNVVPDGPYRIRLATFDAAGNTASRSFGIAVDTRAPSLQLTVTPAAFSPNGDGIADRTVIRWTSSERASGTVAILSGSGVLRHWTLTNTVGGAAAWDGRTTTGLAVPDGHYRVRVQLRDRAGNLTTTVAIVTVDRTLRAVSWSGGFFPQDGDRLARTSRLSVTLARTATVNVRIVDAAGVTVRAVWTNRTFTAGTRSFTWDGRTSSGAYAPPGRYVAIVTATSSLATTEIRRAVVADAFAMSAPASTRVGATLTIRFRSIEVLSTRPVVSFTQPGKATIARAATRLADGSYRVTFTVASGPAGTATLRVSARDSRGGTNVTTRRIAVLA